MNFASFETAIRQSMADLDRAALPSVAEGRRERRVDKSRVEEAVARGASQNNIARALDGGRAADIALAPQTDDGGESGRRRELDDYTFSRRHKHSPSRESSPGKRPSWQDRLKREREMER